MTTLMLRRRQNIGVEFVSNVNPTISVFKRLCKHTSKEAFDKDMERIHYSCKEISHRILYSDPPHVEGFSEDVMNLDYVASYLIPVVTEVTSIDLDGFTHEITCCSEFESKNILLKLTKTIKYNNEVVSNSNVKDSSDVFEVTN